MQNYMFIYWGPKKEQAPLSPDQMQAVMGRWQAWIAKFMASGQMTDPGDALLPEGKIVKAGGVVSDGPFVETKEVVGGYSIVRVKDYAEAVSIARSCPGVEFGGSVEIRPLAGYGEKMKP